MAVFTVLRNLHTVSLLAALFHIPPNGARGSGFQFLHILVQSRYFHLLVFSGAILMGVRCYFQSFLVGTVSDGSSFFFYI